MASIKELEKRVKDLEEQVKRMSPAPVFVPTYVPQTPWPQWVEGPCDTPPHWPKIWCQG